LGEDWSFRTIIAAMLIFAGVALTIDRTTKFQDLETSIP
jgi:drug/metabolite transporter (DMT)-like permease